ncbi:CARDB domain-containing protein [Natranaeroarchaeum aerophilus]|uniref:CARDB domain-containing protein n=1 Tax=Natranaeroarchaeum aerophilus TaxID=2917711 RepID=A0AAE3K4V5_9EURY|nr:CARDB domain-containing protein [Natranaeroarchaeum aerophilus]MCL9813553.1 hypothetical protein [Natranaeroarchaeum aerophilus]
MPTTRVLLVATLCLLALFVAPTVAAQEDSPSDFITIEATDESVATIEDGEIKIRGSIVPHAKASVDEAFQIRSTGNDEQRVWVTSDIEGVEFHRSDTGEPVEEVTLNPGESVGVGLEVDSSKDLDGDVFTIRIETEDDRSSSISINEVNVDPRAVETGESSTVTATVENSGDGPGSTRVGLSVDGTIVSQQLISLRPGQTTTVTFERTFQQSGEYEIAVTNRPGVTIYTTEAGTVTVTDPPSGPSFEVTDAAVSATEIDLGDSVDVTATVANVGDEDGTFTAELAIAGVVFQSQQIDVAAGEEETVTFTRAFADEGTFAVSVSGSEAGEVTVGSPGETVVETTQRYLSNPATASVGLAALVGLLAIGRSSIWDLARRYV